MIIIDEYTKLKERIFNITDNDFEKLAIDIFNYQYMNNSIYRSYCNVIKVIPENINQINKIPFLPISLFKTQKIVTGEFIPTTIFESSGTTGSINSKHYVSDLTIYQESFSKCFELFYGNIEDYCILGLLPSYLERKNASLVYMVDQFIQKSNHPKSGFYLNDFEKLSQTIIANESTQQKTLLIGVSFALLDFTEQFKFDLKHTIVMETGGMKGRREEMTKEALHEILKENFGVVNIHSEYGMTELLSQSYSFGNGIFNTPPWMKILLRSEDDPLEILKTDFEIRKNYTGGINIIDLANINSCCFIATDDLGKVYENNCFETIGRLENSDIRGCGLMIL